MQPNNVSSIFFYSVFTILGKRTITQKKKKKEISENLRKQTVPYKLCLEVNMKPLLF